jgi:hypothetical protein
VFNFASASRGLRLSVWMEALLRVGVCGFGQTTWGYGEGVEICGLLKGDWKGYE